MQRFSRAITLDDLHCVCVSLSLKYIYRLSLLLGTTSSLSLTRGASGMSHREDGAFSWCSRVNSPTECRGEWVKVVGTTGGATILNPTASPDRTTCGRRLPACCHGANNKVEETHPSSQDCNPHIGLTLKISADVWHAWEDESKTRTTFTG